MNEPRIVVFGAAGEMASVAIERLAGCRADARFELYDKDLARLERLASRLAPGQATIGELDLFDDVGLRRALTDASMVMLGAGPYVRTAPPVIRACVAAGVDYLDFDDDIESTIDALELDADARAAGIACRKGCGASPGLSNVMAVDAAGQLDDVESVDVCWVSGDEGPQAFGAAVVEHILHIGAGQTLTWRDGRQVSVETFVDNEVVAFGGDIGDHRLYETAHPEAVTLPRRYPGARSIRVLGGAHPQPLNGLIRGVSVAVHRGQLTTAEAVEWFQAVMQDQSGSLKGWRYALGGMLGQVRRRESSLGALAAYLWLGLRKRHVPYRGCVLVRATGTRAGEPATITVRTATGGPDSFFASSMASITGACVAAFAGLALDRAGQDLGVVMPEDWVSPGDLYAALQRVGVPEHVIIAHRSLEGPDVVERR
jgi:hypothetical protein